MICLFNWTKKKSRTRHFHFLWSLKLHIFLQQETVLMFVYWRRASRPFLSYFPAKMTGKKVKLKCNLRFIVRNKKSRWGNTMEEGSLIPNPLTWTNQNSRHTWGSSIGFFNPVIPTLNFVKSHNPEGYFGHSNYNSHAYFHSRISPDFALKSRIASFK